jgi:hypothetical protein
VLSPGVEGEEVEGVDVQVYAVEKLIEIALVDTVRKDLDVDLGVDVLGHPGQHLGLGLADRRHHGADLAIEVDDVEGVEVGDMKPCHAQAGQCQQVYAADPAAAGDGDALAAQGLLFCRCYPADIARKRLFIAERICH